MRLRSLLAWTLYAFGSFHHAVSSALFLASERVQGPGKGPWE